MTKKFKPGDRSRAVCQYCFKVVTTVFEYRDVPFDHRPGIVRDCLVAICEECNKITAIPAQSTPAINKEYTKGGIK